MERQFPPSLYHLRKQVSYFLQAGEVSKQHGKGRPHTEDSKNPYSFTSLHSGASEADIVGSLQGR